MSEPTISDAAPVRRQDEDRVMPTVVYALYLLGLINGVTIFIGFIMAYALKGGADGLARSHYIFLIRTVWIALAGFLVAGVILLLGLPLTLVLVGFAFLMIGWTLCGLIGVWFVIRCVIGLIYLNRGEPYPRPRAWLI